MIPVLCVPKYARRGATIRVRLVFDVILNIVYSYMHMRHATPRAVRRRYTRDATQLYMGYDKYMYMLISTAIPFSHIVAPLRDARSHLERAIF